MYKSCQYLMFTQVMSTVTSNCTATAAAAVPAKSVSRDVSNCLFSVLYGQSRRGNKLNSYEIGLSRTLVSNVELNLSYYDNKFKDSAPGGSDVKTKGVNMVSPSNSDLHLLII